MAHEIHFPLHSLPQVITANHSIDFTSALHPDRIMPCHVLLYVNHGMFSVVEDGQEYFVREGDLLFLHAGIRHYGVHPCEPGRQWYYIHFFPSEPFPMDFSAATQPPLHDMEFGEEHYRFNLLLPKTIHDASGAIDRSIREIAAVCASRDPLRHIHCSTMLYSLLLQLSDTAREAAAPKFSTLVERLIEYLEAHLTEMVTGEEIAAQFRHNYRYLSTRFRQETGTTIQDFHRTLRVNKACQLLRYTSMNVQEVGRAVGYADPCHFSHTFHRVKGVAPSEYLVRYQQTFRVPSI